MSQAEMCPICGSIAQKRFLDPLDSILFYSCPVCGHYEVSEFAQFDGINLNQLASYLFYHKPLYDEMGKRRMYYVIQQEEKHEPVNKSSGNPGIIERTRVYINNQIIQNWFPTSLETMTDMILQHLKRRTKHIGQQVTYSYQEMLSLLFIDRYEITTASLSYDADRYLLRDSRDTSLESDFILKHLAEGGYVKYCYGTQEDEAVYLTLLANGHKKTTLLQRETNTTKEDAECDRLAQFLKNRLRAGLFKKPEREIEVQNALETLLVGQELNKGRDYDRESGKFEFSGKEYIPDFVLLKLNLCIEVKLLKEKRLSKMIEEINSDITAYRKNYRRILFVIYDLGEIRDEDEFKHDFEMTEGVRVIVVKH